MVGDAGCAHRVIPDAGFDSRLSRAPLDHPVAVLLRHLVRRAGEASAEYVRELTSFPGSKYDDQVDSATQALDHLGSNNLLLVWARL